MRRSLVLLSLLLLTVKTFDRDLLPGISRRLWHQGARASYTSGGAVHRRGCCAGGSTSVHSRFPFQVLIAFLAAATVLSACEDSPADPEPPIVDNTVGRVLFMGNSLTYTNYLPLLVDTLASASGITIESTQIAEPAFALIDHWNVPATRAAVAQGSFDVVVMQQGPSSLPENRDSLRIWTALWAPEIRAAGGEPGLYAVWPDKSRLFACGDVSESYRLAAEDVGGYFFPVGDVWLETWSVKPDAPLYGSDNFHPTTAGSYAAAVTILAVLTNREATSLSADFAWPLWLGVPVDSALAATIREAADVVIERHRQHNHP
jgi:hypothetical protein